MRSVLFNSITDSLKGCGTVFDLDGMFTHGDASCHLNDNMTSPRWGVNVYFVALTVALVHISSTIV